MTNIISAIVTAYDYGTQKYSSWEGLKGLIYKDATSDDSWFTVTGAYIAGKLHQIYGFKLLVNIGTEAYANFKLVNKGHEVSLRFAYSPLSQKDLTFLKTKNVAVVTNHPLMGIDSLLKQMRIEHLVGIEAYKAGRRTKEFAILSQNIKPILTDLGRMAKIRAMRHADQKQS